MSTVLLPTVEIQLSETLDRMLGEAMRVRTPSAVEWYVNYHYLRGARYFDSMSYQSGQVTAFYEDLFGVMPFKYEDILARYQAEVGRITRLDVRPYVEREGLGLEYAQKASIAHVTLDALMRSQPMDTIKLEIGQMLVLYGTVGMTNWSAEEPGGGSSGEGSALPSVGGTAHIIEIVPPWELLPLPPGPVSYKSAQGICRERWVAYDWLAKMAAGNDEINLPPRGDKLLEAYLGPPASIDHEDHPAPATASSPLPSPPSDTNLTKTQGGGGAGKRGTSDKREIYHVRLREIWLPSATGRLARYIIMGGKRKLFDRNFEEEPGNKPLPMVPIAHATYTGGLGFFGRSFVGPLVHLNAEVEAMLLTLFRSVQDLDNFGYTFIPDTWGIPNDALFEAKPGKKTFTYTPDPSVPNLGIHQAQPVNAGTLPGDVAKLGVELLGQLAQQPQELMQGGAPGRVESAKGLDLLYQTSTVPLGGPSISIAEMFSTIYKSILWNTKSWSSLKVSLLSLLDDSIVGIKIDPETGTMDLGENAIPDPSEVTITIRSKEPVDKEQRKLELFQMLQIGVITAREFRIINRKEGLGILTGNDVEWQNYVRATINNILWFGDGKTPGKAPTSPYDVPSIHEYVILRRMASPEFALASKEVQAKFSSRLEDLRAMRGTMPNQMPYPEEAAEESAAAAAMQEQQGPAPGIPAELAGGQTMPGGGGSGQAPSGTSPMEGMEGNLPPDLLEQIGDLDRNPIG